MYNRIKRKNLTKFDYFVRFTFATLLVLFAVTILFLEPYRESLVAKNTKLNDEITVLNKNNQQLKNINSETVIELLVENSRP